MQKTDKKILKGEINYKIQLNEEQKLVKRGVFEKDVSFILGRQASGKTQTAVLCGLDLLFKKEVERLIISRPVLKGLLGALPGTMEEKMELHIAPIKQCLYNAYSPVLIDKYFEERIIQVLPIENMKGTTFQNACTIITEFEDCTYEEFINILTRLGKESKLIFEGSLEQIDRTIGNNSCLRRVMQLENCDLVNFHTLTANHRNESIFKIIDYLEKD